MQQFHPVFNVWLYVALGRAICHRIVVYRIELDNL